ncbi:hypothetical protein DJ010_00995 [Nocardioides silvaticus]|uniref:Uncharacterized protein n=1 Tax=Nocardioides silvaticus TaxID=2201891 RepID=A0A316TPV0_9ACTN|nr:hypothetical protein [Nocardioides silvaticus]PWN04262.1 hypothetical protein DJ010_00995 [Nocardioides silvaticus]
MTQYTDRKVYNPLATKFGNGSPVSGHAARFSVVGNAGGIAGQRAAHFSIYSDNPDIAKISAFPDTAWDPAQPDVGAQYGITWITMADLHHDAAGHEPIAAVVCVGDVVFLNITLSSTLKHIVRPDGEDLNGVTVLIMSLLNHFPSLREVCWADDVTRAGRDRADWSQITNKCKIRDVTMVFGGQRYDQSIPGDELALGALGLVGGSDDPNRRRRMTGKRLMKYKLGGAALAERQMPYGWGHKKDKHGRTVEEGDRGIVPEAQRQMAPVIEAIYRAHANGESYQDITARLIAFEAEGLIVRRDHTDLDNTFARAVDDDGASYGAAKSFFTRSDSNPRVIPSDLDIARYLEGEDPADVFDPDVRFFIAKVELVRTSRYYRRLNNDIRGRNIVLDGISATYRDDLDEYGYFDVLSASWGWPTDDKGNEILRFGVPDRVCREVAARLLRELRAPKAPTGGQAHHTPTRRALQGFSSWFVAPGELGSKYDDEPTQWGVQARMNLSGRANCILLFRRESAATGTRTGRGWTYFGPGESRPDHIAATFPLTELAASVACRLDHAVRNLLDPTTIAPLTAAQRRGDDPDPTTTWRHQIALKAGAKEPLEREITGHRTMAALSAAAGDEEEAKAYAAQVTEVKTKVAALDAEITRLKAKIRKHQAGSATARPDHADISVAAHLVAGLEAAARNNGESPSKFGTLCDETFIDWRFHVDGEDVVWACTALLPLASGGHAQLPLTGRIRNVRTRTGRNLANTDTVVRYLFEEGRELTATADLLQVTRATLLKKRVMPWLVTNGITSRGAKCALVDHPISEVRQELHRWVTRGSDDTSSPTSNYIGRLRATYADPNLSWGDAAVPDDTVWVSDAIKMLTADRTTREHGLPVLDVALALGKTEAEIRELVKPQKRAAGFTRPVYLAYANESKTHVKAVPCPPARPVPRPALRRPRHPPARGRSQRVRRHLLTLPAGTSRARYLAHRAVPGELPRQVDQRWRDRELARDSSHRPKPSMKSSSPASLRGPRSRAGLAMCPSGRSAPPALLLREKAAAPEDDWP